VLTSIHPRPFQAEGVPATICFQDFPFGPTKIPVCRRGKTKADTGSAARGEAPRCRAPTFAESCMTTRPRTKEWFIGMVYVSDDNSAQKLVRNIDVTSLLKSTQTQCTPTELKLCDAIVVLRSRRCPQCVEHTHSSDDRKRHPEA